MINFKAYLPYSLNRFIPNILIVLSGIIPFFVPASCQAHLPNLGLCVLYFWAVSAPEKISLWLVFLTGLCQDSFFGVFLGIFSIGSLLFFFLSLSYYKYIIKKPFTLNWLIFIFIILLVNILKFGLTSYFLERYGYEERFIYESILTVFSYPAVASLCFYLHQKFN